MQQGGLVVTPEGAQHQPGSINKPQSRDRGVEEAAVSFCSCICLDQLCWTSSCFTHALSSNSFKLQKL